MDHIRMSLKAIQWERAKGELRAFAALLGSNESAGANPHESVTYLQWRKFKAEADAFIRSVENKGLHE